MGALVGMYPAALLLGKGEYARHGLIAPAIGWLFLALVQQHGNVREIGVVDPYLLLASLRIIGRAWEGRWAESP